MILTAAVKSFGIRLGTAQVTFGRERSSNESWISRQMNCDQKTVIRQLTDGISQKRKLSALWPDWSQQVATSSNYCHNITLAFEQRTAFNNVFWTESSEEMRNGAYSLIFGCGISSCEEEQASKTLLYFVFYTSKPKKYEKLIYYKNKQQKFVEKVLSNKRKQFVKHSNK